MAKVNALRVVGTAQDPDLNQQQALDTATTVSAEVGDVPAADSRDADSEQNIVRRSVREFCDLHKEMHNLRENLIALGVPAQTVTVLVEMGFSGRMTEQDKLTNTCLEEACGGLIDESILTRFKMQLKELVNLERDMAHARKIARESGLSLPALNALTQMIRQNPGDGGEKVINSFLAYALASEIPMAQIEGILKTVSEKPKSVLPVIEREAVVSPGRVKMLLLRDVLIGLSIAVILMWLLT